MLKSKLHTNRRNLNQRMPERHFAAPSCRFPVLELSDAEKGVSRETVLVFIGLALGIFLAFFGDRLTRNSGEARTSVQSKTIEGHTGFSAAQESSRSLQ